MMADRGAARPAAALWAVIPAAGSGSRLCAAQPKQYLPLAGVAMLQRSIDAMRAIPRLSGVVVVLADGDRHWHTLPASRLADVHTTAGGVTRAASVAAGIGEVRRLADDHSWVLVHDAARPLVDTQDIARLIEVVTGSAASGGLLAVPVQDTIKRAGVGAAARALTTVARKKLWCAQTPQLFRAGELARALRRAGTDVTDEASAMERQGYQPVLVEAQAPNFKITRLQDLILAEAWLTHAAGAVAASAGVTQ